MTDKNDQSEDAEKKRIQSWYSTTLAPDQLEYLYKVLRDNSPPRLVGTAMAVLAEDGLRREMLEAPFLDLLHSPNPSVRFCTISCIRANCISEDNSKILDDLLELLMDDHRGVRMYAFFRLHDVTSGVLAHHLHKSIQSLPHCLDLVSGPSDFDKARGLVGMWLFNNDGLTALKNVVPRLNSGLRVAALLAFSRFGRVAAPEIERFLSEPNEEVKTLAERALETLRPSA